MHIYSEAEYAKAFRQFTGTRKIAGVNLPDFTDRAVYTRTKTGISDSEYEKKIVEQAYKDYSEGKFHMESLGFAKLMKSYVSEVSPEREHIVTEAMKQIAADSGKSKIVDEKKRLTLLDLILEAEIKCKKYKDSNMLQYGGKVKYTKYKDSNTLEYAEIYDSNGEEIAHFSNRGWGIMYTKAEAERGAKLCRIYNRAYAEAGRTKKTEQKIFVENFSGIEIEIENAFDEKA